MRSGARPELASGVPLTNSPGEQSGEDRHEFSPPSMTLGGPPQEAAAFTPGQAYLPTSGMPAGPSHEGSASRKAFRGIPEAKSRGLGGESSLADGLGRAEQARILAEGLQQREARRGIVREERDPGGWRREARCRTRIGPRRRGAARIRLARIIDPRGVSRFRRPGRQRSRRRPDLADDPLALPGTPPRTARDNTTRRPSGMKPRHGSRTKVPPRESRPGRASGGCAPPSRPRLPPMVNSPRSERRGPGRAPGFRRGDGTRTSNSAARRLSASSSGCSGSRTS